MNATLITGPVTCDGVPFIGTYDPTDLWNGWLCPAFTRPEAQRVADWSNRMAAEAGTDAAAVFEWDGDILVQTENKGHGVDEYVERIAADAAGRYSIGAYGWTWYAIDDLDSPLTEADLSYLAAYAALRGDPAVAPYLTARCPECGNASEPSNHVHDAAGHVLIGCERYHVINPNVLGIVTPNWMDWTAMSATDEESCERCGQEEDDDTEIDPDTGLCPTCVQHDDDRVIL